jgi:hypothetical protein
MPPFFPLRSYASQQLASVDWEVSEAPIAASPANPNSRPDSRSESPAIGGDSDSRLQVQVDDLEADTDTAQDSSIMTMMMRPPPPPGWGDSELEHCDDAEASFDSEVEASQSDSDHAKLMASNLVHSVDSEPRHTLPKQRVATTGPGTDGTGMPTGKRPRLNSTSRLALEATTPASSAALLGSPPPMKAVNLPLAGHPAAAQSLAATVQSAAAPGQLLAATAQSAAQSAAAQAAAAHPCDIMARVMLPMPAKRKPRVEFSDDEIETMMQWMQCNSNGSWKECIDAHPDVFHEQHNAASLGHKYKNILKAFKEKEGARHAAQMRGSLAAHDSARSALAGP